MSALRTALVTAFAVLLVADARAQVRGPYLQRATPTEMTVVWMTSASEASAVCYGASPTALSSRATGTAGTQHEVRIAGLSPATRYYYAAGTHASCPPAAAGNTNHYFETSPSAGSTSPFRIWLLGDSGNASTNQANVRDRMLSYVGSNRPDLFVHVGDMAYNSGTTSEFTSRFFGYYPSILQNIPCWPAIGNHEGSSSDSATQTGPYYDAYVLPTDGRAGGLASGTEAYYSFDYGNVHFIALDSYESSRAVSGAQLQWMSMDIAATGQPWIIAFFHHGPYTKGTHDSDTETEHIQMRTNALPILEANGVDLVWGGHSHIYERTYLVHGAYDTPTTAAGHIVDSGDGRPSGNGAYVADGTGAVFVTAGHGGQSVGQSGTHPLMYFAEPDYGSCIVDVSDGTLTLTNVRDDGVASDTFTMQKPSGLVLLTPGSGAQLEQGTTASITWTPTAASAVKLELSTDGGMSYTTLVASTPNDGADAFTVPSTLTSNAVIRISDASNASTFDVGGTFSIVASLPSVAIPYGSTWEYFDTGAAPSGWSTTTGGWASGAAELGYGDGDETTVLYDTDPNVPTVYFRRALVLDRHVSAASLKVLYDDGYAVYVNGVLVASENVANGTAHDAWASATSADNAVETTALDLATNPFVVGTNVIAVLVKQAGATSSDLSFDLELTLTLEPAVSADECALGTDDCDVHATCIDTAASYTCVCNPGYAGTGVVCANVDDCSPNPCQNGGTCMDGVASHSCSCPAGFTGPDCATTVYGCSSSPCQNGGSCVDGTAGTYTCTCTGAFQGVNCDVDVDECAASVSPCAADASCTNTPGSYTCTCNAGYVGDGSTCTPVSLDAGILDAGADDAGAIDDAGAVGSDAALLDAQAVDAGAVVPSEPSGCSCGLSPSGAAENAYGTLLPLALGMLLGRRRRT